jgi:hypothetical protein
MHGTTQIIKKQNNPKVVSLISPCPQKCDDYIPSTLSTRGREVLNSKWLKCVYQAYSTNHPINPLSDWETPTESQKNGEQNSTKFPLTCNDKQIIHRFSIATTHTTPTDHVITPPHKIITGQYFYKYYKYKQIVIYLHDYIYIYIYGIDMRLFL